MRKKFDQFLHEKIKRNKLNIIYIDLTYLENKDGFKEIIIGLKQKMDGYFGINWTNHVVEVEDTFSIKEFKATCGKYHIDNSVFVGDWENYFDNY